LRPGAGQTRRASGPHALDADEASRFKGRFTVAGRTDHPCHTIDMSAEVVALRADYSPPVGSRITLQLERWGRFDGRVIRSFDGGFTVDLEVADRVRVHVAMQLAWLSRHYSSDGEPLRSHERLAPRRRVTSFTVAGVTLPCEILDLSRGGASLRTRVKVEDGVELTIGRKTHAVVVRQTEDGFAVQFRRLLPLEEFDEEVDL
jgi:hypothetical protein